MGFTDVRNAGLAGLMEDGGAEHQEAGVDEEREGQRQGGVVGREAHGLAPLGFRRALGAEPDDRRVQVEVMRHHRGAHDAKGDEKHAWAREHFRGRHEAFDQVGQDRLRQQELDADTGGDRQHEHGHERFQPAVAQAGQRQQDEHIERGDDRAKEEGDAEEDLQGDGRTEELGEIHGDDAQLGREPEELADGGRITLPTGLGEVEAGGDVEAHAEVLEQDRHQVRQQDDPEQRVAEPGAAREVGRPVARIHVADRHEETRPDETQKPAESAQARVRAGLVRCGCPHQS